MTEKQFMALIRSRMEFYKKRIMFLDAAVQGKKTLRRIKVKQYKVDSYTVGSHYRFI